MQYLISLFQQPKHHKYLPWQPNLHTATNISALKLKKNVYKQVTFTIFANFILSNPHFIIIN